MTTTRSRPPSYAAEHIRRSRRCPYLPRPPRPSKAARRLTSRVPEAIGTRRGIVIERIEPELDGGGTATRSRTGRSTRSRPTSRPSRGTVTNAVYGFTSMLIKVLGDEKPDHLAVAFDAAGASTFRKEMDADLQGGPQGDAGPVPRRSCR